MDRRILAKRIAERARRFVVVASAIMASVPLMAGYAPSGVKTAFAALYPDIDMEDVIWSDENDGYFLAKFKNDGFDTRAWFDTQSQCVMVQTDLVTMDRVPSEVYNAFASHDNGNNVVRDVTYVVFPKWQPIYVVLIGEPNIEGAYQLFYTPYGELLRERSTVGVDQPLGIPTFFE